MSDPFLEREKELLKLNESINVKCNLLNDKPEKVDSNPWHGEFCEKGKITKTHVMDIKSRKSCGVKVRNDRNKSPSAVQKSVIENVFSTCERNGNDGVVEKNLRLNLKKDSLIDNEKNSNLNVILSQNASHTGGDPTETLLKDFNIDMSTLEIGINDKEKMRSNQNDGKSVTLKVDDVSLIPVGSGKRSASAEGMIKFLKAKVTILQQELDLSHKENVKQSDSLGRHIELQKKLENAQSQASSKINSLKTQIQKQEQQNTEISLSLKEKETQHQSLKKDIDELKLKLKTANQTKQALENRLQKSQEDLEYCRKNYHVAKAAEKDIQLMLDKERKFYEKQLKSSEKERNDLLQAQKYHLLLIDNLKKQNLLLEQTKLIQIAEKDFMKILDWNNDSDNDANEMNQILEKCAHDFEHLPETK